MGLREKALEFYQNKNQSLALSPDENLKPAESPVDLSDDWEKEAITEIRNKGFADKAEILASVPQKTDDQFLLRTDNEGKTIATSSAMANRVEALLNLIDLCKEMAFADDEEELWSTVTFGLLGQIGAREAAIFLKEDDRFVLKADRGFTVDNDFALPRRSGVEREIRKNMSLHYAKDIVEKLAGEEQTFIKSLNADLLIPITRHEDLFGVIILGKPVGASDYHIDDLLYLKLFGEVLGAFYESVQRILEVSELKRSWSEKEQRHQGYLAILQQLQQKNARSEEILELIRNELKEQYGIRLYFFLEKDELNFLPFSQMGFSQQSIDQFQIPASEPWLWESRHHQNWYKYVDFKNDSKLTSHFAPEDLAIVEAMHILPLFFNKELHGAFLLLEVSQNLISEALSYLQALLQNYFYLRMMEKVNEQLSGQVHGAARDPLLALRKIVNEREGELSENKVPYALFSIQITNQASLENLFGPQKMAETKAEIKSILSNEVADDQFLAEIFPGQFLMIIAGAGEGDLWSISKLLQKKVTRAYPEEDKRPLFRTRMLVRPDKELPELASFLFD